MKQKKKQGAFSGTQYGRAICQEVIGRDFPRTTMEAQLPDGTVTGSFPITEISAGHQVTPQGNLVYALLGGRLEGESIMRQLVRIDMEAGTAETVDEANSGNPAADDQHVAFFGLSSIIVRDHDGSLVMQQQLEGLNPEAHACALLPGGRVAVSLGSRAEERIADLSIYDIATGELQQQLYLQVQTSYQVF